MDSGSQRRLGISQMLDKIDRGKNKSLQKTKVCENTSGEEKKPINTFSYGPAKTLITESSNYFNVLPNFGPAGFEGNRVAPYPNFPKPIVTNTNVPPPMVIRSLDRTVNMMPINQLSSHPPNVTHSELRESEQFKYPLNIIPNYPPKTSVFNNPVNHALFPVPQTHQENNANSPFSFPPPATPSNPFYFNLPGVLPGSSESIQQRMNNDNLQSDKKRKRKKNMSGSSSSIPVLTILPPPPSPPNLAPRSHCRTPPYQQGPFTPSPLSSPNNYSPPPRFKDAYSPVYSKAPPLPPSPILQVPPLPSSPPPPDFDNLMNKPPEPKEPPPKSPLKDPEDYPSYSVSPTKSIKKGKKSSSRTKPSKSITVGHEFLNIKPLNADGRFKPSNNDKFCVSKKRRTLENYNEDPNWKKMDSEMHPPITSNPNFVPKREKYNYLNEPPHFSSIAGTPCDVGGGPPFNPMHGGGPPFPTVEGSPFSPMGGKPFNPMEGPPYIGRGRPPFNVMRAGPRPFRPMRTGPPPFRSMGAGPPSFHPMNTGPPPFRPMRGGRPRFWSRGERPPFPSLTEIRPFNHMGEGPQFDSVGAGIGYEVEEEVEFEEFSSEDENSIDIHYKYRKDRKHSKRNQKVKRSKRSKERNSVEHKKNSKSTRITKHASKTTKVKEIKPGKKAVKLKVKKKAIDYELEPGEYVSDMESEDDCSSSHESETNSESSDKRKMDSEDLTNQSDASELEIGKSWRKPSKFDNYMKAKHRGSDGSDKSEMFSESPNVKEKPKYPRYFKDKVAYISDVPKIFGNETGSTCSKTSKDSHSNSKKKVTECSDDTKKALSPPISSESLKATKTPLIKRLGLVEKRADTHAYKNEPQYDDDESLGQAKIDKKGNASLQTSFTIEHGHFKSYNNSDHDDTDAFKSLHSPSNVDTWNPRNRSNSLSPNNSLDSEEVRLLASTKEILSASKSIFKSPTSPKITTIKKRYEKPIIKVETASKPHPFTKQIEESPNRIDLDSRIKIMFGMKSSGEDDSPEKRILRNAALSHKCMRLLSRPPSPFRSRNAYQFWHRETYYYRKHNPLPKEFFDPTARRKIGIQIKELNEGLVEFKTEIPPLRVDDYTSPLKSSPAEEIKEVAVKSYPGSSDKTEKETEGLSGERPIPLSPNKDTPCSTNNNSKISHEITKVNVLPHTEMELISEESDHKLTVNAPPGPGNLDKFNFQGLDSDVVKLVIKKIIDELKCTIKNKITEDLIEEKL